MSDPEIVDETPVPQAHPMIYAAMAAVLKDVSPVGKTGTNRQQNYKFRSIEDVAAAVHDAMAKNGVFHLPTVLERAPETRTSRQGDPVNVVNLKIQYTFYAADGSSVAAVVWGEASDASDKATNKAMSAADKYALVQAFSISATDMADGDREGVEASPARRHPFDTPLDDDQSKKKAERLRTTPQDDQWQLPRPLAPPRAGPGTKDVPLPDGVWQPPVTDLGWLKQITNECAAFTGKANYESLWGKVNEAVTTGSCTRDDGSMLKAVLRARWEELNPSAKPPKPATGNGEFNGPGEESGAVDAGWPEGSEGAAAQKTGAKR